MENCQPFASRGVTFARGEAISIQNASLSGRSPPPCGHINLSRSICFRLSSEQVDTYSFQLEC
eukprot:6212708-Pleurochrysis_carterae.AAC.1